MLSDKPTHHRHHIKKLLASQGKKKILRLQFTLTHIVHHTELTGTTGHSHEAKLILGKPENISSNCLIYFMARCSDNDDPH